MLTDSLKKRFAAGEVLYGPFIDSMSEDLVEIVGLAGFDFALIDCEHSPNDPASAVRLVRAADARNIPAVIRVNNAMAPTILKMMDIGSSGIMAPLIHDAASAKAVAEAVRYYPMGRRGTALTRAADYGFMNVEQHFARTNSNAFVMVQAESVQAIENLEAIVQVEGLDAVFLGPYDLSQSMGIPGQVESGPILEIIERSARIIRDAGKVAAILAGNYEKAKLFVDWGYQMITYSTDLDIFRMAVTDIVKNLKAIKKQA